LSNLAIFGFSGPDFELPDSSSAVKCKGLHFPGNIPFFGPYVTNISQFVVIATAPSAEPGDYEFGKNDARGGSENELIEPAGTTALPRTSAGDLKVHDAPDNDASGA